MMPLLVCSTGWQCLRALPHWPTASLPHCLTASLPHCPLVPQVQKALERVRQGADVMPRRQLEKVLVSDLGHDWHKRVAEFEWQPRAAASIGQVHSAVMHDGRRVAMKIQYPGECGGVGVPVCGCLQNDATCRSLC
jgi:hypothetical protein